MRTVIYKMVEKAAPEDKWSKIYDIFICFIAILSIVPLMFKSNPAVFDSIDKVTVYVLFADYAFRWITADYKMKRDRWSFVIYPFTLYAILDLISLLPSLGLIGKGFRVLRMMRIFKIFHYSKSFVYIIHAFDKEKHTLYSVLVLAFWYIFVSALIMFSYEPDTFDNFFSALYWATTALTTVGYGDVYPKTDIGRLISMLSSLFGIAVVALPAGIITASFVDEINAEKESDVYKDKLLKADESVIDKIFENKIEGRRQQ